jgi:putative flippase GtrA
VAILIATVFGVLFNFKTTGALVFRSNNNHLIFRFVGSYVAIYFINAVGIKVLDDLGVAPYIGAAILVIPMALLAFILNRRFVFNHG